MERAKIHTLICRECSASFTSERRDAQFCGKSHSSKYTQRTKANLGRFHKKFSDDTVRQGVNLVNAGVTWAKAAKAVGMTHENFRRRVEMLGCQVRRGLRGSKLPQTLKVPTSEVILAYIAAMIDGEGSVQMYRGKRLCLTVHIYNTSLELMEWLAAIGGAYAPRKTPPNRKQSYEWKIRGRDDTLALLMAVEPFMIIKREKAKQAIEFLQKEIGKNYFTPERESYDAIDVGIDQPFQA